MFQLNLTEFTFTIYKITGHGLLNTAKYQPGLTSWYSIYLKYKLIKSCGDCKCLHFVHILLHHGDLGSGKIIGVLPQEQM